MSYFRFIIRIIIFASALILFFIVSFLWLILCGFNFERARPIFTLIVSLICKIGLKVFGLQVRFSMPLKLEGNYLIVSNHLSYLDVLIISSFFPTCFVTSKEMKETPFLGQLCTMGGCLFVERRNRRGLSAEVEELTGALKSGLSVVIFPEAKSTNGEAVIPFKRPLFQAGLNANSKVLPICLNYRTLDGEKITHKNRDKVFWYGDMSFFPHAMTLFKHKGIVADLIVMDSFKASDYPDKILLSDKCYEVINSEYLPI